MPFLPPSQQRQSTEDQSYIFYVSSKSVRGFWSHGVDSCPFPLRWLLPLTTPCTTVQAVISHVHSWHIMWSRVNETVERPSLGPSVSLSLCMSVHTSHHSAAARRCGGFAAVGQAARRYRRLLHGRRSAANASSVTLSADLFLFVSLPAWRMKYQRIGLSLLSFTTQKITYVLKI